MTRRTRTSPEVFRGSVEFLIAEQGGGIEGRRATASMFGVSPRTVRRWETGESQSSQATRESARRRSLDRGRGRSLQVRQRGRFTAEGTIARPSSLRGYASINRDLQRIRRAERRAARRRPPGPARDRAVRVADALPTQISDEAALDLFGRLQTLQDEGGANADWRAWENDYEAWKAGLRGG